MVLFVSAGTFCTLFAVIVFAVIVFAVSLTAYICGDCRQKRGRHASALQAARQLALSPIRGSTISYPEVRCSGHTVYGGNRCNDRFADHQTRQGHSRKVQRERTLPVDQSDSVILC